ncbi:MAG: ATP-binding cassette domain-containing protein [Methermicoccaceae archaeon]
MVLQVVNLGVQVGGKNVLDGVTMYLEKGHTYVLFGQNGSGKSTLMQALIGNPVYEVVKGKIIMDGKDITDLPTDERVRLGMGISFQTPSVVGGVKLRDVLDYCRRLSGMGWDEVMECVKFLKCEEFLDRSINKGFSGGELKRSEALQLMVMNPSLLLLDEPDSGVDMENLALIGKTFSRILGRKKERNDRTALVITHSGHILEHMDADYGMILYGGRIACIGDPNQMFEQIYEHGYEKCINICFEGEGDCGSS